MFDCRIPLLAAALAFAALPATAEIATQQQTNCTLDSIEGQWLLSTSEVTCELRLRDNGRYRADCREFGEPGVETYRGSFEVNDSCIFTARANIEGQQVRIRGRVWSDGRRRPMAGHLHSVTDDFPMGAFMSRRTAR